jgi:peptidoglycan/xylan/chitin deacetylase (PgdA/CDA1 family)
MIFTLSFDDGHHLNLKLSELLKRYGLKATFYLEGQYLATESGRQEVLELATSQEIGAHTFSHPRLTEIDLDLARQEIILGKEKLERVINKPLAMFSYPFGLFNSNLKKLVQAAGFKGARTVQMFQVKKPNDFFECPTTFHIYPFPFRKKDARHLHGPQVVLQPLIRSYPHIFRYHLPINSFFSWFNLTKNLFDYALKKGEVFHLWGHSWEIEKYGLWGELERFFQYVKTQGDLKFMTNGEMVKLISNAL